MKKKASIDIGTNSTRMLVAEVSDQKELTPLVIEERITRLGEGIQGNQRLSADAMSYVLETLAEFKQIAARMSASITDVVATSAARDATNKGDFLQAVKSETGLHCRILSGEEEANLTLLGVLGAFKDVSPLLICDIGGGSTEFIAAERGEQIQELSINIGSRRLTEQFLHHDPVKRLETAALRKYIVNILINELAEFPERSWHCVATGGTATTLALIDLKLDLSQAHQSHKHELTSNRLDTIIEDLTRKSVTERKSITGLHPDRADVILAGALILRAVQAYWGVNRITVSIWDLLHGLLLA